MDEFLRSLDLRADAVILLEGTRALPDEHREHLASFASTLARALPDATFRTGNATGSDEAFAEGVAAVDAGRLQYVLPTSSMGRSRRNPVSYHVSMQDVPESAEPEILYRTRSASPASAGLVDLYERGVRTGRLHAKVLCLLRDTLKVLGSETLGLAPADIGFLYVNPADPDGGGTGHTIRVCEEAGVRVVRQEGWWGVGNVVLSRNSTHFKTRRDNA